MPRPLRRNWNNTPRGRPREWDCPPAHRCARCRAGPRWRCMAGCVPIAHPRRPRGALHDEQIRECSSTRSRTSAGAMCCGRGSRSARARCIGSIPSSGSRCAASTRIVNSSATPLRCARSMRQRHSYGDALLIRSHGPALTRPRPRSLFPTSPELKHRLHIIMKPTPPTLRSRLVAVLLVPALSRRLHDRARPARRRNADRAKARPRRRPAERRETPREKRDGDADT